MAKQISLTTNPEIQSMMGQPGLRQAPTSSGPTPTTTPNLGGVINQITLTLDQLAIKLESVNNGLLILMDLVKHELVEDEKDFEGLWKDAMERVFPPKPAEDVGRLAAVEAELHELKAAMLELLNGMGAVQPEPPNVSQFPANDQNDKPHIPDLPPVDMDEELPNPEDLDLGIE